MLHEHMVKLLSGCITSHLYSPSRVYLLKMPEIDRRGVSGANGSTDVRDTPSRATLRVVLAVSQAAEHGLAPGCADHLRSML